MLQRAEAQCLTPQQPCTKRWGASPDSSANSCDISHLYINFSFLFHVFCSLLHFTKHSVALNFAGLPNTMPEVGRFHQQTSIFYNPLQHFANLWQTQDKHRVRIKLDVQLRLRADNSTCASLNIND